MADLDDFIRTEIKRLLDEKDHTQAWLARRVWISEKHLSTFMRGRNSISFEMAELLLGALGQQITFQLQPLDETSPRSTP